MYNYIKEFKTRDDLHRRFGTNSLMMYALELRFDIDDIYEVGADSITDGHDDKKCDLIYINKEDGVAVIAQAYMKEKTIGCAAPSNKASDLNTAASWLFATSIRDIPNDMVDKVGELRDSLKEGAINQVWFWYVHNCDEKNCNMISKELNTVKLSAQKLVDNFLSETENKVSISSFEVGNETLEEWYNNSNKRISIDDEINVDTNGDGFEIKKGNWKSYVTAIHGKWLIDLLDKYKAEKLFNGNPRSYLGAGKRKNKINLGIMETVEEQPDNFWAFNNGITALVNEYNIGENKRLSINGITIINGAQTTGAIAQAKIKGDFMVPIRFIVCKNDNIIEDIIANNNKQNEILPSDFRSNDKQQRKLRNEFTKYPIYYYSGGRRQDKKTRNRIILEPDLVAQTIESFHGDCVVAYNEKKKLWSEDNKYVRIFTDHLSVEHIIFLYSLSRAISDYKTELREKNESRTKIENDNYQYLKRRGSKMLLINTISKCMESIIGEEKITDLWKLSFKDNRDFEKLVELWKIVIKPVLKMGLSRLDYVLKDGGLNSYKDATNAGEDVSRYVSAFAEMISLQTKDFGENVIYK